MTSEQINQIIDIARSVPLIASGAGVSIVAIIKFFDYQKTRVKEVSVGASALQKLQGCMDDLSNEFNIFKEKFKNQEKKIDDLHSDNQQLKDSNSQLVRTILDFIKR